MLMRIIAESNNKKIEYKCWVEKVEFVEIVSHSFYSRKNAYKHIH